MEVSIGFKIEITDLFTQNEKLCVQLNN